VTESTTTRIGPLHYQVGCHRRRLNLALIFCVYFVLSYIYFDWWMCAYVVLGLVFPYQAKRLAWGTSVKWLILCGLGHKFIILTVNHYTWIHMCEVFLYTSNCIALYHDSSLKCSGVAHVNKGSHSFTGHPPTRLSTSGMSLTRLCSPVARALPHFDWYSFPIPLRVGGWVGMGGLIKCWGGLPAEDGHPSQY